MNQFATLTPHEQIFETVLNIGHWTQKRFIKDSWNSLWATRNSWWTTL